MISTEDAIIKSLIYDAETGNITWLTYRNSNARPGTIAGSRSKSTGYRDIDFLGRAYKAHRIAWLLQTGAWPSAFVDHINGDRDDNRWSNLRASTVEQNNHNVDDRVDNTSGIKGVHWHAHSKKWRAEIQCHRKKRYLGCYQNISEAAEVVQLAREMLHGEFANHGGVQS